MEVIRFSVDTVSLEPRAGFIGFATEQHYFWMQPGEDSTAKDEIWLERDDQGWGGSGGEWSVVLTRNKFTVDTSRLPWMACESIEIDFLADDKTYSELISLLRRAMVDCPCDLRIQE